MVAQASRLCVQAGRLHHQTLRAARRFSLGTAYHVHRAEEESFYILEGQLEFHSEGRRFVQGPRGYVFLPRDIPHGVRVVGDSVARFLVLTTPGGFEGFVVEAGEPATELRLPEPSAPNIDKLATIAAKYRIEILGPLPE